MLAPQVRLELTTLRLTAGCSAIELLRNKRPRIVVELMPERGEIFITDGSGSVKQPKTAHFYLRTTAPQKWVTLHACAAKRTARISAAAKFQGIVLLIDSNAQREVSMERR